MGNKLRVMGICASSFEQGNTDAMLREALHASWTSGATVSMWYTPIDIPHCDGRRVEHLPMQERIERLPSVNLRQMINQIIRSDAIIVATPTYCYNMSSTLKAFIDWLVVTVEAPDYPLKGKVAGLMAVCEEDGAQAAMEKMLSPLIGLGFMVPPLCTYFYNKSSASKSENDWQLTDRELVGRNVVRLARMVRGSGDWNDPAHSW